MKHFFKILTYVVLSLFFSASLGTPVLYLVHEAFFIRGSFTFENVRVLFSDSVLLRSFLNSFFIAFWSCVVSVLAALFLANISMRRRIFGRSFLDLCIVAPLFLPPLVGVVGIKTILSRSGIINLVLLHIGIIHEPIDLLSPGSPLGVVIVQAIHFYPLVYLQIISYLARLNAEFEEAAMVVGAQTWYWFVKITLQLLGPAIMSSALLVFIGSFTDIGTPLLFEYRNTVPVQVFNMLTDSANSGSGYALVFFVGCLSILLFLLSRWFEGDAKTSGSDRSFKQLEQKNVSGLRDYLFLGVCFAIACVSILPHIGVILQASSRRWFMTVLPERYTFDHFYEVFIHPVAGWSLLYSILLSIVSTVLVTILGFVIAWGSVRRGGFLDKLFEYIAMLPLSLPGIVIAFGLMLGFSGTIFDNRNNPTALLILAYTIRRLPFMVRILSAGLRQASTSLEEAAYMCGASWLKTLRSITIPILMPSCIAGAILCFIGGLLEVSDSLLLAIEEKYYPIAKALYALQGRPDGTPVASALAVVVMVIVIGGFYFAGKLAGKKVSQILVQ